MHCPLLWNLLRLLNLLFDFTRYIHYEVFSLVKPLNQWPLTINFKLKDASCMPSSYKYVRLMSYMWHKRTIEYYNFQQMWEICNMIILCMPLYVSVSLSYLCVNAVNFCVNLWNHWPICFRYRSEGSKQVKIEVRLITFSIIMIDKTWKVKY